MKKIIVPQPMHSAAWNAQHEHAKTHGPAVGCMPGSPCSLDVGLEAALRWLSENPIEPTDEQMAEMVKRNKDGYLEWIKMTEWRRAKHICISWQHLMFLAPELKIPDEVEDLMWSETLYSGDLRFHEAIPDINKNIVEAFRRGQKAGK